MKYTFFKAVFSSFIFASICISIIIICKLMSFDYSKISIIFANLIIWTNAFLFLFSENFCYAITEKNYYLFVKDSNDIDAKEKLILWNFYIKEIPNLEKFKKLQCFRLKIDLTNNESYFYDVDKLLYKLNIHKLPRLDNFEINLYYFNKVKIITHMDIHILHKDKYFMANIVYLKKIPQNVTHINLLHHSYYKFCNTRILDNLPNTLENLKISNLEYELTNLPPSLKKLILVKLKYDGKDVKHKIPFDCKVKNLNQIFYNP